MNTKTKDEIRKDLTTELDKCVRCRFCLYACPTFQASEKNETMGPFGRIQTLRYLFKKKLEQDDSVIYPIYTCLNCGHCGLICQKLAGGLEVDKLIRLGRSLLSEELVKEAK